jgi:hypothetical protein
MLCVRLGERSYAIALSLAMTEIATWKVQDWFPVIARAFVARVKFSAS